MSAGRTFPCARVGPIVAKLIIIQGVEVSEDGVSGCPFVTAGALARADLVFFPLGGYKRFFLFVTEYGLPNGNCIC